ncbi:ferritin-like domain-containing protein [Sphaerisporangium corydalis]|uniref:Ferritin-like domain-containing protein n=1 Tax=Sphaerisporangium corydalis TaxID=1441875 RepID=A0ABV9E503_9ACTN|nr:ferritin-like domain-containing protein [Sphaerisporangium corydalis]
MIDTLKGLNKALDAEHAAVYAYGVVGARTSGDRRSTAVAGFNAHRARRDQLRELITARGGTPSESGAAYDLPFPVTAAGDAVRLAALVEDRVTAAYLELAAVDDASLRRLAALAMQECAVRGYGWRPVIATFPGWPAREPGPSPSAEPGTSPPVSLSQ